MTTKQLEQLVEKWQHRLGLDLWDIHVVVAAWDDPHYAELRRSVSYDRAILQVQPWVLEGGIPPREDMLQVAMSAQFVETCVVHELLHAVLRDHLALVQDDLDGLLHRDVLATVEKAYHRINEQTVERLARALVLAWSEK